MRAFFLLAIAEIVISGAAVCAQNEDKPAQNAALGASALPEKLDAKHLPNPYRLHEKVISGGLPEGDAAFQELADLGVKTVISVDGAKPDVATAKKYGLKYVHLPHGYDGVPEARGKELAKAVREMPGPIYIHCHHGKHRSPAAATVACVVAGLLPGSSALGILKTAGTSENYRGLYDSATSAKPAAAGELAGLKVEYKETVAVPPMAEAMIGIEHAHDHLKLIAKNEWRVPADHPALDAAHEALLLREHFTELLRTEDVQKRSERFKELLKQGEAAGEELETALRGGPEKRSAATASLEKLTANCASCHKEIRDVPLKDKAKK